jgi:hypothetical protein
LPKELHEGTGGGDECDDPILGRVKPCGGGAEGCTFPRADVAGDDGGQAVGDGVVETIDEGRETGQGVEILDGDILVEGLTREAPCVGGAIMTKLPNRRATRSVVRARAAAGEKGRSSS